MLRVNRKGDAMNDRSRPQEDRRKVLAGTGAALLAGAFAAASVRASAQDDAGRAGHAKGVPAVVVDAKKEGICATCRYWGGTRRVAEDRTMVYAESLGWCNNADSPHFLTMRTPESGPMKGWKKWEAL
jgi:hypothetical protein